MTVPDPAKPAPSARVTRPALAPGLRAGWKHWGGFVVSGGIAFTVDAVMLELLMRFVGLGPLLARVLAISVAMVAAFIAHRRLTFGLTHRPRLLEFLAYAGVAWVSAGVNYAIYGLILILRPGTAPFLALLGATGIAMFVSYAGMRFGVFKDPTRHGA